LEWAVRLINWAVRLIPWAVRLINPYCAPDSLGGARLVP
jgi:hypothetical protein